MKLSVTYAFKAQQEKVFAALGEPAVLQKCIDGCEKMEKTGEDIYAAHLKIGVAGIKGSYVGNIRIEEKNPPESFTLQAEGKGSPGWVKGTAKIQISPKGDGSELQCEVRGPGRRGDRGGGFAARGGGGEEDARRILPQAGPAARRLACVANKSLEICDLCRLVSLTEYYADLPRQRRKLRSNCSGPKT